LFDTVALFSLTLFAAQAPAATVTDPGDSGANTLRGVIGTVTTSGETITFAPSVSTVNLDPANGVIGIPEQNLSISGNKANGLSPLVDIGAIRAALPALSQNSSPQEIKDWAERLTAGTDAAINGLRSNSSLTLIDGGSLPGTPRTDPIFLNTNNAGSSLSIANLHFKNANRTQSSNLNGGGLLSAYSTGANRDATLGSIRSGFFDSLTITVTGSSDLNGGGVIGAYTFHSSSSSSSIGDVRDSLFSDITVEGGSFIQGGGMLGHTPSAPPPPPPLSAM
jgi:hypothetical protein